MQKQSNPQRIISMYQLGFCNYPRPRHNPAMKTRKSELGGSQWRIDSSTSLGISTRFKPIHEIPFQSR